MVMPTRRTRTLLHVLYKTEASVYDNLIICTSIHVHLRSHSAYDQRKTDTVGQPISFMF